MSIGDRDKRASQILSAQAAILETLSGMQSKDVEIVLSGVQSALGIELKVPKCVTCGAAASGVDKDSYPKCVVHMGRS